MDKETAARIALGMYAEEPCRICGKMIKQEDLRTAVFAGYSIDSQSRSAHKPCWDEHLPTMESETIEEMIAELGAPRNFAEQALIYVMRQNAEQHAAAESKGAPDEARYNQYGIWSDTLATKYAIIAFRQHGDAAVIPGVYGVPKEGTR